ncbi:MAG TPA: hypothetical protein VGE67_04490 [Haloferula sp.]
MKRNAIIAIGFAALAVFCGVLLQRGTPQESAAGDLPERATTSRERKPPEEDPTQRNLIARYSEARVNLAKHAAEIALAVERSTLEIGQRLAEMHRSKEEPKNNMLRTEVERPLNAMRRRFGDTHAKLQLSPEQEEQAVTIQLDLFDEQAHAFQGKVARLESRKDELQRLMLASDACHRKEITGEEYRSLLAETDGEMREALMPPDGNRLGMESPFSHRDFQQRFVALLDERQREVFEHAPKEFYLEEHEKQEKVPVDPPAMSLDSRDKKLAALAKMLGALLEMLND